MTYQYDADDFIRTYGDGMVVELLPYRLYEDKQILNKYYLVYFEDGHVKYIFESANTPKEIKNPIAIWPKNVTGKTMQELLTNSD